MLKLSFNNALSYLTEKGFGTTEDSANIVIEQIPAKNFNLLVRQAEQGRNFFVKQERFRDGATSNELEREWVFHQSLAQFTELEFLRDFTPEIFSFDKENSILICNYRDDYQDLMKFYDQENRFPTEIPILIGNLLGKVHRVTFQGELYRAQLDSSPDSANLLTNLMLALESVTPSIFSRMPADGIKFFVLYQRYPSLHEAIINLAASYTPCCLTHNDLKLNNIIVNHEQQRGYSVRILDWERASWGDPACDLGFMISSYLQAWLESMMLSNNLSIDESLELATVPLATVHPSINGLVQAYLQEFPEVTQVFPDFSMRTVQFAGIAMIQQILSMVQYQKTFSNIAIAMLQVSKSLICRPKESSLTVFGSASS